MAEEHNNPSNKQVKSANSWEKADLGSSERNEKFLRLMGAKKKEHHGRIVIGDGTTGGHRTSLEEAEKLSEGLAEQYQAGLEHTLAGKRRHLGLGFHDEPPATAAEEEEGGVKGEATKDLMGPDSEENGAEAPPSKSVRDEDSREAVSEGKTEDDDDDEEEEEEEEEEGDDDDEDDDDENDDGDDGPSPPKKKK